MNKQLGQSSISSYSENNIILEDGSAYEIRFTGDGNFNTYSWDVINKHDYVVGNISGKGSMIVEWVEPYKSGNLLYMEKKNSEKELELIRVSELDEIQIETLTGRTLIAKIDRKNKRIIINGAIFQTCFGDKYFHTEDFHNSKIFLNSIGIERENDKYERHVGLSLSEETFRTLIYSVRRAEIVEVEMIRKYQEFDENVLGEYIYYFEDWKMSDGTIKKKHISTKEL